MTYYFYLMRKELGSQAAQELLEDTFTWTHACSIDGTDVQAALAERWPDFEDCLASTCAQKLSADYIITRDANGFKKFLIPSGTASDFMEYVFDTTGVRYSLENLL